LPLGFAIAGAGPVQFYGGGAAPDLEQLLQLRLL
jgi:hypothetical protein